MNCPYPCPSSVTWKACVWDRPQKVVFKRNLDIKPILLIWGLSAKKKSTQWPLAKNSKVQTGLKTNSKQDSGSWHFWVKGWFFELYITLHWFPGNRTQKVLDYLEFLGSKAIIAVIESLSQNCKEINVHSDVQFPSKPSWKWWMSGPFSFPTIAAYVLPNRNHNLWFLKYLVSFMVCILHSTKTEAPREQVPCCCCSQLFPHIL